MPQNLELIGHEKRKNNLENVTEKVTLNRYTESTIKSKTIEGE